MKRAWELFCYGACFYTPIDRISWSAYMAMLPYAGSEAYRHGEL